MFDLEKAITEWRKELAEGGVERPDLLDELESHLREDIVRLTKAGWSVADAYQAAARELGNGPELRGEFSKVDAPGGCISRSELVALKVLGSWMILMGANGLINPLARIIEFGPSTLIHLGIFNISLSLLMTLAGIGLFRRRNAWRIFALVWCAWGFYGNVATIIVYPSVYSSLMSALHHGAQYRFLGLSFPIGIWYVIPLVGLFMHVLGLCVLGRRRVRSFFLGGAAPTGIPAGETGLERLTIAEAWERRLKQALLWISRMGLASLALFPASVLYQGDVDVHERNLGLVAIAVVILAVWASHSQRVYGLLPGLKDRRTRRTARLAGGLLSIAWAAACVGFIRSQSNLTFGAALADSYRAFTPLAVLLGFMFGQTLFKIETAFMEWRFIKATNKSETGQYV